MTEFNKQKILIDQLSKLTDDKEEINRAVNLVDSWQHIITYKYKNLEVLFNANDNTLIELNSKCYGNFIDLIQSLNKDATRLKAKSIKFKVGDNVWWLDKTNTYRPQIKTGLITNLYYDNEDFMPNCNLILEDNSILIYQQRMFRPLFAKSKEDLIDLLMSPVD